MDLPLDKITKRLEILKNYIILEDIDGFNKEVLKLNNQSTNDCTIGRRLCCLFNWDEN